MPSKSKKLSTSSPTSPTPPVAVADAANPTPKPKKSKTPKLPPSSPTTPAAPAAAAGDAAPLSSRKSDRKRKATSFPDDAGPASTGAIVRCWSDADVDVLLRALHRHRLATGAVPTASTLGAFYDALKPSLPANITQDQVYNKIRTLRTKFVHAAAAGQTDTPFYRLAADAWADDGVKRSGSNTNPGAVARVVKVGAEAEVEAEVGPGSGENEDGEAGELVLVRSNLGEYCRKKGLPVELMEEGLRLVPPSKARALEEGWRRKRDTDMKLMAKQCELDKEAYLLFRAI